MEWIVGSIVVFVMGFFIVKHIKKIKNENKQLLLKLDKYDTNHEKYIRIYERAIRIKEEYLKNLDLCECSKKIIDDVFDSRKKQAS